MASYNPSLSCCCDTSPKNICCLSATLQRTCTTSEIDSVNCTTVPGEPQTISYSRKYKYCNVASEELCSCDYLIELSGEFGGFEGQTSVVTCEATYYPDVDCESEEGQEICSGNSQRICPGYICGPCGPVGNGCTAVDLETPCPNPPNCTPQPCCTPPPPTLCCCRTIDLAGSCISSASCGPCPENPTPGTICGAVSTCDECTITPPPPGGPGIGVVSNCPPTPAPCECGPPGCVGAACVKPCGEEGGGGGPPICSCDGGSTTLSIQCGGGLVIPSWIKETRDNYGDVINYPQGNFMSGLTYDPVTNTYTQNRLFLFGYGYHKL